MNIRKLVYGIYPRSERLRISIGRWERRLFNTNDLSKLIQEEKNEFYNMVKSSKIDYFTDPLFNWHDIFRPLASSIKGMEVGPLTRFYETNTFYRMPLVNEIKGIDDLYENKEPQEYDLPYPAYYVPDNSGYVTFLPGIGTFFKLSESKLNWKNFSEKILNIYSEIIKKGKSNYVFFYEESPVELEIYNSFKEKVFLRLPEKYSLESPGDLSLFSIITNDVYKSAKYCNLPGFPVIDSSTTRIDGEIHKKLNSLVMDFPDVLITHNNYFDFLPRKTADMKLNLMGGLVA